jgi:hypothetical protein
MQEKRKVNTDKILLIITLILFAGSWIWFIVQDSKPKTANDLINDMVSEEAISELPFVDSAGTEESINLLGEYRFVVENDLVINQYFIVDTGGDNVLLVETNSGLENNELMIKRVTELNREDYEKSLLE